MKQQLRKSNNNRIPKQNIKTMESLARQSKENDKLSQMTKKLLETKKDR